MKKIAVSFALPKGEFQPEHHEIIDFFRIINDCYADKDLYFTLKLCDDLSGDIVFFLLNANTGAEVIESYQARDSKAASTQH